MPTLLTTYQRCEAHFVRERAPEPYGRTMTDADAVAKLCRPLLKDLPQEHVLALLLDAKQRLLGVHTVAIGGATECAVEPACVFRCAILVGAAGIVLVHQHPSGDPTPSSDDVLLTRRIEDAGRVLGIPLLDHVVVAEGGFYGFASHGFLSEK